MDWIVISLCLVVLNLIVYIYRYLKRDYDYWSKRGVKGPKPIPIFGNYLDLLYKPQPFQELNWFNKYGKIYGHFMGKIPIITIGDPKLIKNILVKDFHLFTDRSNVRKATDPINKHNLFRLTGDDWKRVRSIISPAFSSGKMRKMYPSIRECLANFLKHLDRFTTNNNPDNHLDVKHAFGSYTMDVIATCAFAIKANIYDQADNPFLLNAIHIFDPNPLGEINQLFLPTWLSKWLARFKKNYAKFYVKAVREVIAKRLEQTPSLMKQNDFIQLLIDADKDQDDHNIPGVTLWDESDANEAHHVNEGYEELAIKRQAFNIKVVDKRLSQEELVAQAIMFLMAGYETTSTTLSTCAYQLALNPLVQHKLWLEIDESAEADGDISYEVLAALPYLDAVLAETLRLHAPPLRFSRCASTDYKLGNTGITLPAGQQIEIPIYAIHHSPEFYPNPEKFDPDRFMPQNKHKITPYTYLPFGAGPRNCIGMRFSLLESKLCLAHLVRQYRLFPTLKTDVPFKYRQFIRIGVPKQLYIGIERRK